MYNNNWYLLTVVIGIFGHIPNYVATQNDVKASSKSKFGKLLNSIANKNEERLNALKRYTELDKYNVANGILRIADDKQRDPMVAVMLINKQNAEDNKVFEIFDADEVNTYSNTPVRNIVQRIKEHYHKNSVRNNDIDSDSLSTSSSESSESENELQDILHNTNDDNIERVKKESSDGEEINSNRNQITKPVEKEETSDGEEKNPIVKETMQNKEPIVKETLKASIKNIPTNKNKVHNTATTSKESHGEEVIVHGKEKVKLSDIKKDKKHILRLFKSCNKQAMRRCKKACNKASREVCKSYKCSRGMKKSAKRNCKRECKDYFSYR